MLHFFPTFSVFDVACDIPNAKKRSRAVITQWESPGVNRSTQRRVLVRPKFKTACQVFGGVKKCQVNVLISNHLRESKLLSTKWVGFHFVGGTAFDYMVVGHDQAVTQQEPRALH